MLNGAASPCRLPAADWPSVRDLWGGINHWEIIIAVLRCLSDCVFAYYARSSVRSCRRRWNHDKMAGDATHNNAMRLCIYVLPVPPASAPCARRIAGGLSMRCAINLITGDTFWEPVIGRKPVNRLTGYRFTSLLRATVAVNSVCAPWATHMWDVHLFTILSDFMSLHDRETSLALAYQFRY